VAGNRCGCDGEQARPLSPAHPGEGEEEADGLADPAGDPGAQSYTGGRTILVNYLRTIRTPPMPRKKV
jgi:hypothetical protein